jgi:hypothetical protein
MSVGHCTKRISHDQGSVAWSVKAGHTAVGAAVGSSVGDMVGAAVGSSVGAGLGL